jgi:hypothetical protein
LLRRRGSVRHLGLHLRDMMAPSVIAFVRHVGR